MSYTAVKVDHLSKKYRLGVVSHGMLFKDIQRWWARVRKKDDPNSKITEQNKKSPLYNDEFWALKDVSFEVQQGEAVGIIGKNGAGKSTLLKILSRLTSPTEGSVKLKGRIASLLEVGTGFHPELTGRDNIFLNGAILGMKKKEIASKLDEIIDFSGIEKFINTPVKRYSSGMYVRLAFAVAAHLESEILVLDEVLAVGDSEFQKKCLGKMDDVAKKQGRTVLFVSHNMGAIVSLCNKSILLKSGCIDFIGSPQDAAGRYLEHSMHLCGIYQRTGKQDNAKMQIDKITLLKNNKPCTSFYNTETLAVRLELTAFQPVNNCQVAIELYNDSHECIYCTTNLDRESESYAVSSGKHILECPMPLNILRSGDYYIRVSSSVPNVEILDIIDDTISFNIQDIASPVIRLNQWRKGIILPEIGWLKIQ